MNLTDIINKLENEKRSVICFEVSKKIQDELLLDSQKKQLFVKDFRHTWSRAVLIQDNVSEPKFSIILSIA